MKEERRVILDNGAYEGEQVASVDLAGLAAYMRPTWVVAPDVPNQGEASCNASSEFVRKTGGLLRHQGVRFMWILHGYPGDFESFKESYKQALWLRCDIGLSRLTKDFGYVHAGPELIHVGQARWKALHMLRMSKVSQLPLNYVHAFGYLGQEELLCCKEYNFDSLDTSAPIWRGLNGYTLDDPWPDFPFDVEGKGVYCRWTACKVPWPENLERLDKLCGS